MPKEPDHHTPAPLLGAGTSSGSRRLPAAEIVYIPTATSPSEWTRKDKNVVTSAIVVGVFAGLMVWTIVIYIFFRVILTGGTY